MKRILYLLIVILSFTTVKAQVAGYHGKRLSAGFDYGVSPSVANLNTNYNQGFLSFNTRKKVHIDYVISDRLNIKVGFASTSSAFRFSKNENNITEFNILLVDSSYGEADYYARDLYVYFDDFKGIVNSKILSLELEYYPQLPIPLVGLYYSFGYNYYMTSLEYHSEDFGTYYYYDYDAKPYERTEETKEFGGKEINTSFSIVSVGFGIKRVIQNRVIINFGVDVGLNSKWIFDDSGLWGEDSNNKERFIDGEGELDKWEIEKLEDISKQRVKYQSLFHFNLGIGILIY